MQLDFLGDLKRTHRCGELRLSDAGSTITLMGWVNRRRDHGNLIFIDLRDRSGITQIVFDKERNPEMHERVESVRNEYVLAVTGMVESRSEGTRNPKMETGEIEVIASELKLLNESKVPPFFPGDANVNLNEEVRLKYRYLDLRRPEMHANIEMRHRVTLGHPQLSCGRGLLRDRDAVHDALHSRGRARLPGAEPRASGRVLRPAAVAADLQAVADDRRPRPLLPDCALLPRRGSARRPPAGVHPDRSGADLPDRRDDPWSGGRLSRCGLHRRRIHHRAALSADALRRGHPALRNRQARPAPSGDDRREGAAAGRCGGDAADRSVAARGA